MTSAAEFEAYGPSHLSVIGMLVIGVAAAVLLGRRVAGTDAEQPVRRVFAVAVAAVAIPLQGLQLLPDEWDPETSLPFALCDLAWVFAVHALWTRSVLSSTVTYLWGITLTTQGIVTPDLHSEFPELRFLMFWGMHLLIVWAAVHLVLGLKILPTWATYRLTMAITVLWAVAASLYNAVADTNYGYLNAKPESASALDLLGPWPVYVLAEIVIIATVWAALTWPAARRPRSPRGTRA